MKNHSKEPGRGVLYWNDKKVEGTKQPDWKGGFTASRDIAAGEWVKMAAWKHKTQVGELVSLAEDNFVPDPSYKKQPEARQPREVTSYDDGEIPF
jgi:hypothetical protein